jgi:hypothetical protein
MYYCSYFCRERSRRFYKILIKPSLRRQKPEFQECNKNFQY